MKWKMLKPWCKLVLAIDKKCMECGAHIHKARNAYSVRSISTAGNLEMGLAITCQQSEDLGTNFLTDEPLPVMSHSQPLTWASHSDEPLTVGWSEMREFWKKIGISMLPNNRKLIHIIKKQAFNFLYSRLISPGAAIEMIKSKNCSKSDFLYCFSLESMLENGYCRAKIWCK